jgi:hypothetical protein
MDSTEMLLIILVKFAILVAELVMDLQLHLAKVAIILPELLILFIIIKL